MSPRTTSPIEVETTHTASPPTRTEESLLPNTMHAIVRSTYGGPDVLALQDIERPKVGDDEVLVRVHASSVNAGDRHLLRGEPYLVRLFTGIFRPKKRGLGQDLSGRVEAVGANVQQFRAGDEVFGEIELGETFAEFAAVKESQLALRPMTLSHEQAAAVPVAGLTALQAVRDHGQVGPGQSVLIIGASGGVGHFALQMAKALGAEVTAVCRSRHLPTARRLGADHVIDAAQDDFTLSGARFDVILDIVGNRSLREIRGVLAPQGRYVAIGGPTPKWFIGPLFRMMRMALASRFGAQQLISFVTSPQQSDLRALAALIEAEQIAPVVDRTFDLHEVPDALRYWEARRALGKIVICIAQSA